MRTKPDRVHLGRTLEVDPRLDQVGGEDTTLEQVVVVNLECFEHLRQRSRHLRHVRGLIRRQLHDAHVNQTKEFYVGEPVDVKADHDTRQRLTNRPNPLPERYSIVMSPAGSAPARLNVTDDSEPSVWFSLGVDWGAGKTWSGSRPPGPGSWPG